VVPDAEVSTEAPVIAPPTVEDGDTVAPQSTPAPAPRVAPDPTPVPPVEAETAPRGGRADRARAAPEAPVVEEQRAGRARGRDDADHHRGGHGRHDFRQSNRSGPGRARRAPCGRRSPRLSAAAGAAPAPPDNAVNDAVAAALAEANRPAARPRRPVRR
jgi:hypothetical protein